MKKRFLFLSLVLAAGITGCDISTDGSDILMKDNSETTLKDIAFDKTKDHINNLYILEGDVMVPFGVVKSEYKQNATLLVRRDVLPSALRFNDYSSYYENSEIDQYLNNSYAQDLESVKDSMVAVPIDITSKESIGSVGNDTIKIERSIFLLSYIEVGLSPSPTSSSEGLALEYFKKPPNRITYTDERHGRSPASWFLRTPNTYFDSAVYSIGPNGEIGTGNANNENGIRPAICLKSDISVERSFSIEGDVFAYVIKE